MPTKIILFGMLVALFMLGGCNVKVTNLDEIEIPQPEKEKIYRFIDFESPQHLYFQCECEDTFEEIDGNITIGWMLETRKIEETERFIVNHYDDYDISISWWNLHSCIVDDDFYRCWMWDFKYNVTEEGITYNNRCELDFTDNAWEIEEQIIDCFRGIK